jgi:KDO2-lipid IV(A) lauroyltransferase
MTDQLNGNLSMNLLFRLLSRFPLPLLHMLGACVGGLLYLLSGRERRRIAEHLGLAFPEGAPPGVAWASALQSGRAMLELPWLWLRPIEEVVARVNQADGWDAVEAARARGVPLLFFTPHIGCFELAGQYIGARLPITVLYRESKNPAMAPLYSLGRNRGQMVGAPADTSGVRTMLKALKKKEAVGILPDQVPQQGEGVWLPYFGRLAYTMTLAARFSEIREVATFFVYVTRHSGGRYHFHVQPTPPLAGDEAARALTINQEIEKIVLQQPDQYFWSYNRYKAPNAAATASRQVAEQ